MDAQADLSLRWAHMAFRWFCYAVVHLYVTAVTTAEEITAVKDITTHVIDSLELHQSIQLGKGSSSLAELTIKACDFRSQGLQV